MNRRAFFKSMIGGVAATAAVRTWPFRVFSFPTEIKVARALPMDLGFHCWSFAGLPMVENEFCPPGKVYLINGNYIGSPAILEEFRQSLQLRGTR